MKSLDLDRYRAILAAQPFSVLVGASLDVIEPGHAQLSLPIKSELLQQHGFVHGGVLAYLADNALTYAGGTVLGDSLTSEFKINYVRPAIGPGRLFADATSVAQGKTQAVCRCDIYLEQGEERKLCAVAQGTIRKVEK